MRPMLTYKMWRTLFQDLPEDYDDEQFAHKFKRTKCRSACVFAGRPFQMETNSLSVVNPISRRVFHLCIEVLGALHRV